MKKFGLFIVILFFLLVFPGMGHAAWSGTHIFLDGQELKQPTDAQAGLVQGSVMVPLRVIAQGLGYEVNWEKKSGSITIKQKDNEIQLILNKNFALVNKQRVDLAKAPVLNGDTTLVPLRFVGERMGLKVNWDNSLKSAYLDSIDGGSDGKIVPGIVGSAPSDLKENSSVPVNIPEQDDTYTPDTPSGDQGATTMALINGINFSENRLMVAVSGTVQPNVFSMTGPDRIVIDIPNADFAKSFGDTFPLDASKSGKIPVTDQAGVSQVRYSMFSSAPATVRIVIDLNGSSQFTVTNAGDGLLIVNLSSVSSTPPSKSPTGSGQRIVVIDAGHGGTAPGTTGVSKKLEKNFTLSVVLKVQKLLLQEKGIYPIFTRTTDATVSLEERTKIANDAHADLFVSIHGNSITGTNSPSGSETYYTRDASIPLANIMHKHLVAATGFADRKVRYADYHVTRETKMPAVLLEVGYLSNKNDETAMLSEAFQQRLAEEIVAGIKEYLGL